MPALLAAACKFDLRFVPEEQSFKGRQVRDEALDVPAGAVAAVMPGWSSACALARWRASLTLLRLHRVPLHAAEYMPLAFQARALQHTNVQLTWDADDDTRRRALTRRLNTDELKEDDFKASSRARAA